MKSLAVVPRAELGPLPAPPLSKSGEQQNGQNSVNLIRFIIQCNSCHHHNNDQRGGGSGDDDKESLLRKEDGDENIDGNDEIAMVMVIVMMVMVMMVMVMMVKS